MYLNTKLDETDFELVFLVCKSEEAGFASFVLFQSLAQDMLFIEKWNYASVNNSSLNLIQRLGITRLKHNNRIQRGT